MASTTAGMSAWALRRDSSVSRPALGGPSSGRPCSSTQCSRMGTPRSGLQTALRSASTNALRGWPYARADDQGRGTGGPCWGMVLVSTTLRQRHAGFLLSGQISTLHAWPHRWCPMPSGPRAYGLRLPSASGEGPKGTCRTMEAGGLPSPIDPKCLSRLAIRPLRFLGRHGPASDRPEASCPSCAVSFGLTGGRYLVKDVRPDETHAVEFSSNEKMPDEFIIPSIMLRRG
jgi:hypothetical protein